MTSKQREQAIMSYDAISVINSGLIDKATYKEDLKHILDCLERFLNYDFGNLDPEQIAKNNANILTGEKDFFGAYDLDKGQLYIALFEGKYRIVYNRAEDKSI